MKKLSTDREILETIFNEYASTFNKSLLNEVKDSTIYIPIDITSISECVDNDARILFGRLYYHLDHKYRYKQDNGTLVHLFALKVDKDRHCINYPYLAAILSEYREQHASTRTNFWLAFTSLVLSLAAIVAQIVSTSHLQ